MTRLLQYLKPYQKQLFLVMALLLVQAIANLYLPDLNADIINNGIARGDTEYILKTGGFMLLVTLLLAACSVVSVYWGSKTAMSFGRDLRSDVFRKVQSFSQAEVDQFGTPSLITRTTNDVQQVQMAVLITLNVMISAPVMCIGGIIMALRQDVPLSISIIVIVPVMAVVIGVIMRRALPLFKSMQVKIDRLNQVVREKLAGVRVIRAFVKTDYEEARFDEANLDLTTTALKINRMVAITMPLLMLIVNISMAAIMWFGAHRIDSGAMPIGNLTAFIAYTMQILIAVMMATVMFIMIPRASASAERILEVLETEPSISAPKAPVALNPGTADSDASVEFRDVEFTYPGAETPVLRGISFIAYPGETTAIVGGTGCGKSTLINLIPRFYDVTGGSLLIDGVDIREIPEEDLRNKIGFVPQKAFLFSGTIASNLRYGKRDATDDELWHALRIAQAADFVAEMPGQLEAPVSQGGTNFSGGQKQRLAIARALVKRPKIYVFDDSFSALDFKTDAALRAALNDEVDDAIVFIVAQRVSTIMNAERIIVLDKGEIVGMGTHEELMKLCSVYREIVFSQLSEEEVA
ncbi:MAG TPA: ABC transporter ATP-binding protein [Bacillota bacterium]|nr:ABC transporter ATP-binding protein [Bacillota bacterium]HQD81289.1 ABC transporter ATP-binding protein [Bacillota bacterium]